MFFCDSTLFSFALHNLSHSYDNTAYLYSLALLLFLPFSRSLHSMAAQQALPLNKLLTTY